MSKLKAYFAILVGSRKFLAFIAYFCVTTILMLLKYVDGNVYMAQVTVGLVAFMGTNFGEHLTETVKSWIKVKANEIKEKIKK